MLVERVSLADCSLDKVSEQSESINRASVAEMISSVLEGISGISSILVLASVITVVALSIVELSSGGFPESTSACKSEIAVSMSEFFVSAVDTAALKSAVAFSFFHWNSL